MGLTFKYFATCPQVALDDFYGGPCWRRGMFWWQILFRCCGGAPVVISAAADRAPDLQSTQWNLKRLEGGDLRGSVKEGGDRRGSVDQDEGGLPWDHRCQRVGPEDDRSA